ncbi:hypothetical protein DB29_00497 [Shouchella clausii]|nr:hypothetical protein DB29_00497 [Shouchella clausii]
MKAKQKAKLRHLSYGFSKITGQTVRLAPIRRHPSNMLLSNIL